MSLFICQLFCLLFLLRSTLAVLVNVTVDDTFGDPNTNANIEYSPFNLWSVQGKCAECSSAPDTSFVLQDTWHFSEFSHQTGTGPLTASFSFTGSAIYVYCVLSNSARSDMTFFIDETQVGVFAQDPALDGSPTEFSYNVTVFAASNLPQAPHTLEIKSGVNNKRASIFLDYIMYSTDSDDISAIPSPDVAGGRGSATANSPSTTGTSESGLMAAADVHSSSQSSRIVGGVLGTLFGLLFIGAAFYIYRRYFKYPRVLPLANSKKSWADRFFPLSIKRNNSKDLPQTSSFNPDLLVRRPSDRPVASSPQQPSVPIYDGNGGRQVPYMIDPPLPAQRSGSSTPQPLLPPSPLPSAILSSSKIGSIQKWQQRTQRETRGTPVEIPDMSEELSSYYDDNATESHRVRTPPPTIRHFTVMNK